MSWSNLVIAGWIGLVMVSAASWTAAAPPEARNFTAPLSGGQEVPPVETHGQGVAKFQLSHDVMHLSYRLNVANIGNVSMSHIHLAEAGTNGTIVVWLYPEGPPPVVIEGRTDGTLATGVITADDLVGPLEGGTMEDLLGAMRGGGVYVNVHTTQNPPGEVRGRVQADGPA